MDKTVQYTIITNKEYSFPNCINKLCPSAKTWSKINTYFCSSFLNNRYLQVLMSREGPLRSTREKNISGPQDGRSGLSLPLKPMAAFR